MRFPLAVIAATAVLALTACGSSEDPATTTPGALDQSAKLACDDFAGDYKAAQTSTARIALANKVNKWAQQSQTNRIAQMGTALARGSESSPDAWKLGADAFAQACIDAGWKAS